MLNLKAGKEHMLVNGKSDVFSFTLPLDVIELVGVGLPNIPLDETFYRRGPFLCFVRSNYNFLLKAGRGLGIDVHGRRQ